MGQWSPTRRELILGGPVIMAATKVGASTSLISPSRNMRFLVVGDWGRDGKHYQRHVAAWMKLEMETRGCDFIASTGDNFYEVGVSSSDDPQWKSSYEDVYAAELRALPWYVVAGNHDWGGNIWAQLDRTNNGGWRMPWMWYDVSGKEFGRPDVHLFFIDTVSWIGVEGKGFNICGQVLRKKDVADQKKWLAQALSQSQAAIKLVFGHHPIYSVGPHGGKWQLHDLDKMLIGNNVSAYICGHDHCLYHIHTGNMDYVCSGGGSKEMSEYTGGKTQRGCVFDGQCGSPRWISYLDRAGFAVIDVERDLLRIKFIDRDGVVAHSYHIPRRDRFDSTRPGVVPIEAAELQARATARAATLLPCDAIIRH